MSINKLPIIEPPIIGLQYLAYPLSILFDDLDFLPWFYSNYIQLQWDKDFYGHFTFSNLRFDSVLVSIPCLEYQRIYKHTLIANNIDINTFIRWSIDNKWYIYTGFDEFYIPFRNSYKNNHFEHDVMIHGYNLTEKIFYILGYNDKYKFTETTVDFNQFKEASSNTVNKDYNTIILFRKIKKLKSKKYDFNLKLVHDMLADYLESKNSFEKAGILCDSNTSKVFGLQLYNHLKKYFKSLYSNQIHYDIRPLHILFEHKKCMNMRLNYMLKYSYIEYDDFIFTSYKKIEKNVMNLRNMQIKYSLTNNKELIQKIIVNLDTIAKYEKIVLQNLIDKIEKKLVNSYVDKNLFN